MYKVWTMRFSIRYIPTYRVFSKKKEIFMPFSSHYPWIWDHKTTAGLSLCWESRQKMVLKAPFPVVFEHFMPELYAKALLLLHSSMLSQFAIQWTEFWALLKVSTFYSINTPDTKIPPFHALYCQTFIKQVTYIQ